MRTFPKLTHKQYFVLHQLINNNKIKCVEDFLLNYGKDYEGVLGRLMELEYIDFVDKKRKSKKHPLIVTSLGLKTFEEQRSFYAKL